MANGNPTYVPESGVASAAKAGSALDSALASLTDLATNIHADDNASYIDFTDPITMYVNGSRVAQFTSNGLDLLGDSLDGTGAINFSDMTQQSTAAVTFDPSSYDWTGQSLTGLSAVQNLQYLDVDNASSSEHHIANITFNPNWPDGGTVISNDHNVGLPVYLYGGVKDLNDAWSIDDAGNANFNGTITGDGSGITGVTSDLTTVMLLDGSQTMTGSIDIGDNSIQGVYQLHTSNDSVTIDSNSGISLSSGASITFQDSTVQTTAFVANGDLFPFVLAGEGFSRTLVSSEFGVMYLRTDDSDGMLIGSGNVSVRASDVIGIDSLTFADSTVQSTAAQDYGSGGNIGGVSFTSYGIVMTPGSGGFYSDFYGNGGSGTMNLDTPIIKMYSTGNTFDANSGYFTNVTSISFDDSTVQGTAFDPSNISLGGTVQANGSNIENIGVIFNSIGTPFVDFTDPTTITMYVGTLALAVNDVEIDGDINWTSNTVGPVLKDSAGVQWRIGVSTLGVLSATAA